MIRLIRSSLVASALAMSCAAAQAESIRIGYDITLAGLAIGNADLAASIDGDRYKLDLRARMTGLAGAITKGSGAATSTGTLSGSRPNSSGYALTASNNEMTRTIRMALAGGAVKAADIAPPLEDKADRVVVNDSHRRGVIDPVSALLMPVLAGAKGQNDPSACNRTLPVYDGASRFDVILSYKSTNVVRSAGYTGPVLVCAARYVPQAGHRPGRKATQFMVENRDMEVWLAPVGAASVLIPYKISVKTMIGMSIVQASSFVVQGSGPASGPGAGASLPTGSVAPR